MKKKIIMGILAAVMIGTTFVGCGKENAEGTVSESGEEDSKEDEEDNEPENLGEVEDKAEAGQEQGISSAKENDWLEEQGLHITPQGDFTFDYSIWHLVGGMPEKDMGTGSAEANIKITETIEDGYRKVEAVLKWDKPGLEQYFTDEGIIATYAGVFCFDRYTGKRFERADLVSYDVIKWQEVWENNLKESGSSLEDIPIVYAWETKATSENRTPSFYAAVSNEEKITVLCPKDYDGTVFGVQYVNFYNEENREENSGLYNPSAYIFNDRISIEGYKDVGPYIHGDCVFFTATDK